MKLSSFEAIVDVPEGAGARHRAAGDLAVNAHGDLRLTRDVDLIMKLEANNTATARPATNPLRDRGD